MLRGRAAQEPPGISCSTREWLQLRGVLLGTALQCSSSNVKVFLYTPFSLQAVTESVLNEDLKEANPKEYWRTVNDNILRMTYYWWEGMLVCIVRR